MAYVNTLMSVFFNEHKIHDYSVKRAILDKVVRKHVWEKLNKDPIFIPSIIERANEYNEETQGCITTTRGGIPLSLELSD